MTNKEAIEVLFDRNTHEEERAEAKVVLMTMLQECYIVDKYIEMWDGIVQEKSTKEHLPVSVFTEKDNGWELDKVYWDAKKLAYDCFEKGKSGVEILVLEGDRNEQ